MSSRLIDTMQAEAEKTFGGRRYATSGSALVDYFSKAPAARISYDGVDVSRMFRLAMSENPELAIALMFWLRDIRGGQGERDSFWSSFGELPEELAVRAVKYIPEFGSWADVIKLAYGDEKVSESRLPVIKTARELIEIQLSTDLESDSPSLLAKWMPSKPSRKTAEAGRQKFFSAIKHLQYVDLLPRDAHIGTVEKIYRTIISDLRGRLNVVERKMSAGQFDKIDFSTVPSQAHMRYGSAFARNAYDEYSNYLKRVESGEQTINASTLTPPQIVYRVSPGMAAGRGESSYLDTLWNNLPPLAESVKVSRPLVVPDVSGSMFDYSIGTPGSYSKSSIKPIHYSVGLALYMSERIDGPFANRYISFSAEPAVIKIDPSTSTLGQRVRSIITHPKAKYSTNIMSVFELLLGTAKKLNVSQEEMPGMVVMISDMKFNNPHIGGGNTDFDEIERMYQHSGYNPPLFVFWMVGGRDLPVSAHHRNVVLLGGANPSTFNYLVTGENVTPFEQMKKVALRERYISPAREVLGKS